MTYSDAIEKVMLNNGGFASLKLLYTAIWLYKDKAKIVGKTPDMTIQEKVQRDHRFTRIAKGVYALTNFIERIENENLGYFCFEDNNISFKKNTITDKATEKERQQKIRIGQSEFRNKLLNEMKACPITGIDNPKILIASHIKPWAYCDNKERMNIKNGLILSPLFDKLFDKGVGLISFTDDRKILISKKLTEPNRIKINIEHHQIITDLDTSGREIFLEYHRKYIFQD